MPAAGTTRSPWTARWDAWECSSIATTRRRRIVVAAWATRCADRAACSPCSGQSPRPPSESSRTCSTCASSRSPSCLPSSRKGFVTREKSAEDGRVTVVRLTDAGAEAAPSPEQMQRRTDALDFLTDDEQGQLESLADKVTETLEARLAEMGVDPHQGPGRKGGRGRGCDGGGGRGHGCDGSGAHSHGHDHGHGCDGNGGHGHGHGCEGGGGRRHGMRRGPYRLEEQEDGHTWQA